MVIDLAGVKACGRDVKTVSAVMVLTGSEQVVETPEMGPSGHPKALAAGEQPHRSVFEALLDLKRPLGIHPQENQPVGAVGGRGQGNALLAEPGREFRIEVGSGLLLNGL